MVKQWKRSLSQSDILSDGTPFDGSNIDQPVSEAGGVLNGWQAQLTRSLSREVSQATSGNGTVTVDEQGVELNADTTDGDTAELLTTNFNLYDSAGVISRRIVFAPQEVSPYSDECEIGFMNPGTTGGASTAYLDLTSGEYQADGTTEPATLSNDRYGVIVLTIELDYGQDEVRFTQEGAVSESVTITGVSPQGLESFALLESNGNADSIRILQIREEVTG